MKRSDLLLKYKQDNGVSVVLDLRDDDTESYIEWLESLIPEDNSMQILSGAQKVMKYRFINEVKMRMPYIEIINYETHQAFVESIKPEQYGRFLNLFEENNINQMKVIYQWNEGNLKK